MEWMPSAGFLPSWMNLRLDDVMTATQINRNINDLHPEDQLNRLRLRDWMIEEQKRQGVSDKELSARVGHLSSWAHCVMKSSMWRAATLQKMVRALGYRLTFNVKVDGVAVPAAEITLADAYANNPNIDRYEEAVRRDLCDLGRRYREASKVTALDLGRRLNSEAKTVLAFESGDSPFYLLVTAQRFFRALGGELVPVMVKEEESGQQRVFPAPEGRWPSAISGLVNVIELPTQTMIWNTNAPEIVVAFPAAAWKAWLKAND